MIKIFDSERIDYVKVDPNLINDYLKLINDIEVQKGISDKAPFTVSFEEEMNWVKENMEKDKTIFSMIEKTTNEFIGNIEVKIEDNKGELGISITRDKQDKHFGREAINRIIKYSYEELKLDEICLNVHGDNARAIKCYESCGFVIIGEGKRPSDYHMIHQKELNYDKKHNI